MARLGLLALCLLLPTAIRSEGKTEVGPKSCLWKVSSKQNTVYLLGAIHLMREDGYPLNQPIESAYHDAQT